MESLVTVAITGPECITNKQTDRQTFFFIYIDGNQTVAVTNLGIAWTIDKDHVIASSIILTVFDGA